MNVRESAEVVGPAVAGLVDSVVNNAHATGVPPLAAACVTALVAATMEVGARVRKTNKTPQDQA